VEVTETPQEQGTAWETYGRRLTADGMRAEDACEAVRSGEPSAMSRGRSLVSLADRMRDRSASSGQDLHMQLPKAKALHERESLKRTIAATDKQIDAMVYELYGPTREEPRQWKAS
jgi:hypothetical protein